MMHLPPRLKEYACACHFSHGLKNCNLGFQLFRYYIKRFYYLACSIYLLFGVLNLLFIIARFKQAWDIWVPWLSRLKSTNFCVITSCPFKIWNMAMGVYLCTFLRTIWSEKKYCKKRELKFELKRKLWVPWPRSPLKKNFLKPFWVCVAYWWKNALYKSSTGIALKLVILY